MKPTVSVFEASPYGPLHLWEFISPVCWVRAATEEEARATLERHEGKGDYQLQRAWPDDQPFTMTFDGPLSPGYESDCKCPPEEWDDENYCPHCGSRNSVTLPAGKWANDKGTEWVTYVYEG